MADYIGKDKVIGVANVEGFTTPLGGEVVKVLLQNSHPKLMTKKAFDLLVSSKESDDTSLQKKKFEAMVPELMHIIIEYDLPWYELESLLRSIKETYQLRMDRASSYRWRDNDDSYFAAGSVPSDFWTILEAQEILNSAAKNVSEKGKGNNGKGVGGASS